MLQKYRKILLVVIFFALGLVALQVPLFTIKGAKGAFTIFDFWGPSIGMFLSPIIGAVVVFAVKVVSALFGTAALDWWTIARFFPLAFGTYYLATNRKIILIVPLLCMALFISHPEGRIAWVYTLYWLIPLAVWRYRSNFWLKALGSTFTAHAVGGSIFIYSFNLPASFWIALIPQVFIERVTLAFGIGASYLVLNSLMFVLETKLNWKFLHILINEQYVIKFPAVVNNRRGN